MIVIPHTAVDIPVAALEALRAGRTAEAVRIVHESSGVDLATAKARVDAAMAVEHGSPSRRSPVTTAFLDFLAGSMKFPLACAMGAGALGLWIGTELFPHAGKYMDTGLFMLMMLGVPMIATAVALMGWARRWRKMRQDEALLATAPSPPARPRFGGLPDADLPAAALAALNRGDAITAIKLLRDELGLGLAEAQQRVEAELAKRR